MDINRANMDALFQTFNAAFSKGMQSAGERPGPEDIAVEDIAMVGRSSGAATIHAWLNQVGGMREWVGDRSIANLESGKLTVTNRQFEKTVAVPRNDIFDDQYGVYSPLIQAMGVGAGSLWLKLAIDALVANGNWADGAAFFGTTRTYGSQTISNKGTSALTADTFAAARIALESFKLHGDEPGEVVPFMLLVGPTLRETAWNIVKNDYVSSGTGKGGAVRNPNQGLVKLGVSRRLTGAYANYWYLLGTQGGMLPVYVQKRKDPALVRLDRDTDENVFMRNEYYYGTDARGEAFLTLPHLAYFGQV